MSILNQFHPEVFTGYIEEFGFHKIERQSRTVLKNIMEEFFYKYNSIYKTVTPEIVELENSAQERKLYIENNFPFTERKLPLLTILCTAKNEKKSYLGGDNLLYTDYKAIGSTGQLMPIPKYGNFYNIEASIVVVALSPDMRMQLSELLNMCFGHYYRWHYMYKDSEENCFNITPNTSSIRIGNEREVNDKSNTSLLYLTTVSFTCFVEYIFSDISDQLNAYFPIDVNTSTGGRATESLQPIMIPVFTFSSTGEIINTDYITSTAMQETDYKWWDMEIEEVTTEPEKVPID